MARPKKMNVDYFSHDNGMRNDRKIKALRTRYGHLGYSVWCMTLESLAEADGLKIPYNEEEIELLAGDFISDAETLRNIFEYLILLNLLQIRHEKNSDEKYLVCNNLLKRVESVFRKRVEVEFPTRIFNDEGVSGVDNLQSKVNKSKVNKSKKNRASGDAHAGKDFMLTLIQDFTESVMQNTGEQYLVVHQGKERKALGSILHTYKREKPEADSDQCRSDLKTLWNVILRMKIKNEYLRTITLPKIASHLNEYRQLANEANKQRHDDERLLEAIRSNGEAVSVGVDL